MPARRWSICALFYGDYLPLARRCLDSLDHSLSVESIAGRIRDIRIGANAVAPASYSWIRSRLRRWAERFEVWWYEPDRNVGKYPLMRRIFREVDWVGPLVMWFDDDSYLEESSSCETWWQRCESALEPSHVGMIGQIWKRAWVAGQPEWVRTQPWCNPSLPIRVGTYQRFCTGGWWCIRREVLQRLDWPPLELRHCGGDMLLGAALEQSGLSLVSWSDGVRINADEEGRQSRSPRRGIRDDPVIGSTYRGIPLSTDHQRFSLTIERIAPCVSPT